MQSSSTQLQTVAAELASSAERVIAFARQAGAEGTRVEIEAAESSAVTVTNRVQTERSFCGTLEMTVTVFRDGKRAFAKSSDLSDDGLRKIVRAAIESTAATEPDPAAGFADSSQLARDFPDLDLHHPLNWSLDDIGAHAQRAEDAALAHDPSIKASKGVTVRTMSGTSLLATSAGFHATAPWSVHSIACAPVAFGAGEKQIGFWGHASRAFDDLAKPEEVGALAARRAIDALGATQVPTQQCPVLFEPSASLGLLAELVSSASGDALYRSGSFLKDDIDSSLFPPHVQLDEDPFVKRGMASRCFDSDGIPGGRRKVVEDGRLRGLFLGLYAARRLNLTPTGNGYGPHNRNAQYTDPARRRLRRDAEEAASRTSGHGDGWRRREPLDGGFLPRRQGVLGRRRRDPVPGERYHDSVESPPDVRRTTGDRQRRVDEGMGDLRIVADRCNEDRGSLKHE